MAGQIPAVIFDDIEEWACGYVRPLLSARPESYTDDVFVSNEIPKNAATGEPERRARMVIFRRDGGGRLSHAIDQPRLSVDCWAQTKSDAMDLARMVCALLDASPGDANVKTCVHSSGPTRISDPSKQPRVYATFDLTTKGTDL